MDLRGPFHARVNRQLQKLGESNMKKRILLLIPILLLVAVPLLAQDESHSK